MKRVVYTKAALKSLRRIPANAARLIVAKVDQYAADPTSLANNVTALKGREGIRLRVQDWRVIMRDGVVLEVLEIGARGSVYD